MVVPKPGQKNRWNMGGISEVSIGFGQGCEKTMKLKDVSSK